MGGRILAGACQEGRGGPEGDCRSAAECGGGVFRCGGQTGAGGDGGGPVAGRAGGPASVLEGSSAHVCPVGSDRRTGDGCAGAVRTGAETRRAPCRALRQCRQRRGLHGRVLYGGRRRPEACVGGGKREVHSDKDIRAESDFAFDSAVLEGENQPGERGIHPCGADRLSPGGRGGGPADD